MARSGRDQGPENTSPPRASGNAGGMKQAWESGTAQDKAAETELGKEYANDSDDE